jgi:hypothetical protein
MRITNLLKKLFIKEPYQNSILPFRTYTIMPLNLDDICKNNTNVIFHFDRFMEFVPKENLSLTLINRYAYRFVYKNTNTYFRFDKEVISLINHIVINYENDFRHDKETILPTYEYLEKMVSELNSVIDRFSQSKDICTRFKLDVDCYNSPIIWIPEMKGDNLK